MRWGQLLAGALLCLTPFMGYAAAPATPQATSEPSELGLWLSAGKDGVFSIEHCGNALCGKLVGMDYDGEMPKDVWGRAECHLWILTDFVAAEDQKWRGHILDPRSGRIYQAYIWLSEPNVLKLRGFVLGMPLLGQTETWTRYTGGSFGPQCKMSPQPH